MTTTSKLIVKKETVIEALQLYFDLKVFKPTCHQIVKSVDLQTEGRGSYEQREAFVIEVERSEDLPEAVQ